MKEEIVWDEESCKKEALKYRNRTEWFKKSFSSFIYSKKHGFLDKICKEIYIIRPKITKEDCLKSALKYNDSSEWRKKEIWAYRAAYKFNILDLCLTHMENTSCKWTKKSCIERCRQFSTLRDWSRADGSYYAAKRFGVLEKCREIIKQNREK